MCDGSRDVIATQTVDNGPTNCQLVIMSKFVVFLLLLLYCSFASNVFDPLSNFSTTFRRRRNLFFSIPTSKFSTTRRNFQSLLYMLFFLFKVHVSFSSNKSGFYRD